MNNAARAIVFMCFCKLVFATQDVIIKEMSGGYPVHQIMVIRSIIAMFILLIVIRFTEGFEVFKNHTPGLSLFRGALLFWSFTLFYLGLSSMPLTTATVLFFTAPFFITALSIPFLNEQVGYRRWLGIFVGFIGVLIILRPNSQDFGIEGLFPVAAAFLYAIAQLLARKLGIRDSAAVMTLFANVTYLGLGVILAIICIPFEPTEQTSQSMTFLLLPWSLPKGYDALLIIATGFTGAVGFWLSTQAYRISEVNLIAPFEYVMLVWVPILSYLMWKETPDFLTIIGTLVIVGAGLYVVRRDEIKTTRPFAYKGLSRTKN